MKTKRNTLTLIIRTGFILVALLALVIPGLPGRIPTGVAQQQAPGNALLENNPPFDFNDAFYTQNGIDPTRLIVRVGTPNRPQNVWVVDNSNTDLTRNNIRTLETAAAFDIDGNLNYFNVFAVLNVDAFLDNPAGVRARTIADSFRAIFFPKTPRLANGDPGPVSLGFAVETRRQDNAFETKDTYFCQNLLGFWVAQFAIFTKEAFKPAGKRILKTYSDRNGFDADGTPLLRSVKEVDELIAQGLIEIRMNPLTGGEGTRWLICPVIQDPRQNAIRSDAFLGAATKTDGSAVTPAFPQNFLCLQLNGNFCTCQTMFCRQ
jgi:hypothetical protein